MTEPEAPLETGWLPSTPTDDTLLRSFLRNQAELNALLARAGGGRSAVRDGVDLADADSPVAYLNQAVLHRPVAGPDDPVLDVVADFFRDSRAATLLSAWPTPDLTMRGWVLVGHPAFVVRAPAAASPTAHPPHPTGVEVSVAADPAGLAIAEEVLVRGYPVPEAVGAPTGFAFPEAVLDSAFLVRIGHLDQVPVAVGASYPAFGVVNLCMAATLPEARHRGVWRALVLDRCGDEPDLPAAAFTSDDSRPGFVRLGFLPVLRFTLWAVP